MRNQLRTSNQFNKLIIVLVSLLLPLVLVSCSSATQTPEEAAKGPCETFDKIGDSMAALDRAGVMSNAAEASKQFEEIASVDPRFGQFAQFLKEVSETGSTGDPFGVYSDMLFFCIPINSPE
jgi:hypothetical protein